MPDTSVCYFSSAMSGAPSLSGTAGTLIAVLDACLINGFGSVTLDSLVVADNVATGTISTGHNLALIGGAVGPVIEIAGATPSALNGKWRVASVPGSTTFTFSTAGISDQTATGTITAKRATPGGWSKAFSGTNLAAYCSLADGATGGYFRVDDTVSTVLTIIMCETMSDINTGTNGITTYFTKTNPSGTRAWVLIADSRAFYVFSQYDGTVWSAMMFGDIVEFGVDPYACVIVGNNSSSYGTIRLSYLNNNDGSFICREYTGTGTAVGFYRRSASISGNNAGSAGATYPNPVGSLFLCSPISVWKTDNTVCRGLMPGLYDPIHNVNAMSQGDVITSVAGLEGRGLVLQKIISASQGVAVDISGPWR